MVSAWEDRRMNNDHSPFLAAVEARTHVGCWLSCFSCFRWLHLLSWFRWFSVLGCGLSGRVNKWMDQADQEQSLCLGVAVARALVLPGRDALDDEVSFHTTAVEVR